MIRIGFDYEQKQKCIEAYLSMHKIEKVYIFYFKKFKPEFQVDCEIEYVEYQDIEKYKYFYRLVGEINNNSLLIFDECMRTQNRNELIYNCAHHYCNQSQHKIIFEYFPIIENTEDFIILLNFEDKNKYKGKSFDIDMLNDVDIDIECINRLPEFDIVDINVTEKQLKQYEEKKNSLFDNLGNKHPDTVSTNLELFVGNFKKNYIKEDKKYLARNARYKKYNISTYKEAAESNLTMLDYPVRQLDLNDYIKRTLTNDIDFISSKTKVDLYYISKFKNFKKECESIYDKTNIQQ